MEGRLKREWQSRVEQQPTLPQSIRSPLSISDVGVHIPNSHTALSTQLLSQTQRQLAKAPLDV